MNKNFHYNEAPAPQPVIFDQIFAEKVGGGLVKNAAYDRFPGQAVSADGYVLKAARLVEAITAESTSIKVSKRSGLAVDDIIASAGAAAAITAIDASHADYDILTVSLGIALAAGAVVYHAKALPFEAGYYDATSSTEGALKVVASGATDGQINLADVVPYKGTKELAANDYVLYKDVPLEPKYAPAFVLGTFLPANCGDELAKLVNGANVRKETALFPAEIAAQMKGIHLV